MGDEETTTARSERRKTITLADEPERSLRSSLRRTRRRWARLVDPAHRRTCLRVTAQHPQLRSFVRFVCRWFVEPVAHQWRRPAARGASRRTRRWNTRTPRSGDPHVPDHRLSPRAPSRHAISPSVDRGQAKRVQRNSGCLGPFGPSVVGCRDVGRVRKGTGVAPSHRRWVLAAAASEEVALEPSSSLWRAPVRWRWPRSRQGADERAWRRTRTGIRHRRGLCRGR